MESKASTLSNDIQIEARQISDSRGRPTVEVRMTLGAWSGVGDVPAGASKGEDEARTVSVPEAIDNINNVIAPMLRAAALDLSQPQNVWALERLISDKAGENYGDLGANATLPVSRALWQLAAAINGDELYGFLAQAAPELARSRRVNFLMNIFNGGLHALKEGEVLGQDRIDIQEIMVVPMSASTYEAALKMGDEIDAALKEILVGKFGADRVTRADEAGFSVKGLGDSGEAFGYVFDAIKRSGYTPGVDVKLALDVAASSFFDTSTGMYRFQGEDLSSDQFIDYLVDLVERYDGMMLSIEDGLAENDWQGWVRLSAEMKKRGVVTVGDDLFVTQLPRLSKGVDCQAAHAILIKVNQNGSVAGTLDVMKYAQEHGVECIVSHRSGETLDASIADLAYATGALGLKTGDPQPEVDFPDRSTWVRRAKYLRMVDIEARDHG